MNRAERRRLLKEGDSTDKLKRWLNGLTADQRKLFSLTVNKAVDKELDRINKDTVCVLDSCYATAIDDNLDISVTDIKKIVIEANAYMEEVKEYLRENREGYFKMLEDEKLINEVKKDIVEFMKGATIKSKALVQLKNKYNIPANVLCDLWLQVKSENSKAYNKHTPTKFKEEPALEEEKEKFLHNIGTEMQEILNKEVAIDGELPYVIEEKELEEAKFENSNKSKLKIISQTIKIQGEYDIYIKDSTGIKTTQRIFKDIKDFETYKESSKAELEGQKDSLKEQIEELQLKLRKLNEDSIREYGFISELEEVFKM